MVKAIDMRLRPPYKSNMFMRNNYMTPAQLAWREQMKFAPSKAAEEGSMEEMIKEMDQAGIEIGAAVTRMTPKDGAYDNSELISLMEEYPGRFISVPQVEYFHGIDVALKQIDDFVINGPGKAIYMEPGFRINPILLHADDERLYPIYEKCQANNVPIILQYGGGVNPIEYYTVTDINHIAVAFPDLKVCISHGGWPQAVLFCQLAYAYKNVYICPDMYFDKFPGSADYQIAAQMLLQNKMLFGSAYPLLSLQDAVDSHLKYLPAEVVPKVMYDNAAYFLGLDGVGERLNVTNH